MKNILNKGLFFEHEIAEKLKAQGFIHVKVTKASSDYGADILAYKDGLEYVIQCKKYEGTVGFSAVKDIATAMDIYQADKGILVCDTSFSKNALYAIEKIDKPIELITLEEILHWKALKEKTIKPKPFSYQKKILSKLAQHRKKGNKSALLVMATGLGKTLVAAWDLKSQIKKKEKALFLVHRKDILIDNAEKFYRIINQDRDDFKFGIYFGGKKFQKEDIIFSTFQTVIKHHKDIPCGYFDYLIIDEAHHSPATTYSQIISYFKPKFILGITATPKRISRQENNFIEKVFGNPLIDLDLAEALIRGYLSPVKYSVLCDNIDYKKLKSVHKKLSIEQLNKKYFIPTKDEDIERIILKEIERIQNPRTIIFCPNIKYINSIKSIGLFKDVEVYHSRMDDFSRELIFRRFKLGKISALLVVDLFNEGIDVPEANLVVFLRTTYSPTVFFQQLGRGLRKSEGKEYLRVLDFVGVMSRIKKSINAFGHLLIIQDFVEKIEKQRKLTSIQHRQKIYKDSGFLDPLELDFYQAGKQVKHKETTFTKKSFLEEIKFIKAKLIKSDGWTEEEILDNLEPICKKLGCFPSREYLKKIGRADLDAQIGQKGGVYYFAKKLGFRTIKKQAGYWNDWGSFRREILPICRKLGKMPSGSRLISIGRSDLLGAINKVWGGPCKVGTKLGYATQKPKNYWVNFRHLKARLLPICKKLGRFPTAKELFSTNQSIIVYAIMKLGGFRKIAKRLKYGLKNSIKPTGYWDKWENLKRELLPICRKFGRTPNISELIKIGRNDLGIAINRRWGGISRVSNKIGYQLNLLRKPTGYWDKWENLKRELLPICKKLGKMPSGGYLRKIGRCDLDVAINRKGGISRIADKLGYSSERKPKGYWNSWNNLKKELLPICNKLSRFPTQNELKEMKRFDLINAMRTFGSSLKIAKEIGY